MGPIASEPDAFCESIAGNSPTPALGAGQRDVSITCNGRHQNPQEFPAPCQPAAKGLELGGPAGIKIIKISKFTTFWWCHQGAIYDPDGMPTDLNTTVGVPVDGQVIQKLVSGGISLGTAHFLAPDGLAAAPDETVSGRVTCIKC
eukprot:gene20540-biopygen20609